MSSKLDKFYTKPKVAKECITTLYSFYNLSGIDKIVEPSCGSGNFSSILPEDKTISIDISPEYSKAIKQDFLQSSFSFNPNEFILTIGNPPFGIGASLAVEFFNKSAEYSNVIAFILPRIFKRNSIQNRLNLNFHLMHSEDIPMGSFIPESMKAKCCFMIWERRSYKRDTTVFPVEHSDFIFTTDITKANIAVKAYGGTGDCGKVLLKDFDKVNYKAYHFIICDKDIIPNFYTLDYYPLASDTTRQDSIGKKDLIWLYSNKY